MGHYDFKKLLFANYLALYRHIFGDITVKQNDNGDHVINFINYHQIKGEFGGSVFYADVWSYIVANEDKHEWWML